MKERYLNNWVYEQTKVLGRLVGILGGSHSSPFGFYKAISEKHGDFGILQIDAHCDLRKSYENLTYSHASVMYNALNEIPQLTKLVQAGVRDSPCELELIRKSNGRVVSFFDKIIANTVEGDMEGYCNGNYHTSSTKSGVSFDIDSTQAQIMPLIQNYSVPGGFEIQQVYYFTQENTGKRTAIDRF